MDAATEVPDSYVTAVNQSFDAAVEQALRHRVIRSQAERLALTDEEMRDYLAGKRAEILATVRDKTSTLGHLYSRRSQLTGQLISKAGHNRLSRFGVRSGDQRTQHRLEMTSEGRRIAGSIRTTVDALEAALTNEAIPTLRLWLNRLRREREEQQWNYQRQLDDGVDTTELHGPVTSKSFILTHDLATLGRLLARIPGGSVGVAGPRGSGKSTALDHVESILAAAQPGSQLFRVRVSAPVEYVPKEFLGYLHEEICSAWLSYKGIRPSARGSARGTGRLRWWWDTVTIVVPVLLAVAGVWLMGDHTIANGLASMASAVPLVLALATVVGAAALGAWTARRVRFESRYSHLHIEPPFLYRSTRPDSASVTATMKYVVFLASTVAALIAIALVYASGLLDWMDASRAAGLALVVSSVVVLALWLTTDLPVAGPARASADRYTKVMVMTAVSAAALSLGIQGLGLVLAGRLYDASAGTLIAGGALAAAAAALAGLRTAPPAAIQDEWEFSDRSVSLAVADLRRLRYQRTRASGWTAGAKVGSSGLPVSVESGTSASVSDVEQPLTVPELTQMMRNLLTMIGRENATENFKIVICIDELDKLEGGEGAKTFLNEIKGVFTIPNVYFLVSVSEDAMASFERRGMGFRDVFDSAFDEIIHLPQLSLTETADLVLNRISNVPRPFVALAHCLTGGLARDVIRTLGQMTDAAKPKELRHTTLAVIHREIRGKWQAFVSAVRPIPLEPQVTDMLKVLYVIDRCTGDEPVEGRCLLRPGAFDELPDLRLAVPESSELADFRTLQRLGGEYLGFIYFCRTLIELFDFERNGALDRFIAAEKADRLARQSLEYLARARQHLGVNPRLAWEQISFFREEHDMEPVTFPVALLGSPGVIDGNASTAA